MPAPRTIVIGDIHGCSKALAAVLDAAAPSTTDTVVTLGDIIDRGPDSRGVMDLLVGLSERCCLIPLLGNHEELLLGAMDDVSTLRRWLAVGGGDTLRSYNWTPGGPQKKLKDWFPKSHLDLLSASRLFYETPSHIFVHAGLVPNLPLAEQSTLALLWRTTDRNSAEPHVSGKVIVVGHTPQRSGDILDLGFLMCIDTNCGRGGWLTGIDVGTGRVWQADQSGRLRINYVNPVRSGRRVASGNITHG